jgi:hypothetical protein
MNEELKTVLSAIRAAQGVLRDGQHHSHTELAALRDILFNAKLIGAVRVLSAQLERPARALHTGTPFPRDLAAS